MNRHFYTLFILAAIGMSAGSVYSYDPVEFETYTPAQFRDYWYNHGAELSRFTLDQMRYGEIHKGDAVLVFVTEAINPEIQIKADYPGPKSVPILKLNAVRKFFTGIYPYSIMTSIFAPVDFHQYPLPFKITFSAQEWCGHVYMQMNLADNIYRVRMHSYFEKEGDQDYQLNNYIPEDAIWIRIRIAPNALPLGQFIMIPGTIYARLAHRPLKPQKAIATLETLAEKSLEGNALVRYEVGFPDEQRSLRIYFEKRFPYRIQKWEESYRGLSDSGAKVKTTRAVRTHTIMDAYWQHHRNKDRKLLRQLWLGARELGSN